MHKLDLKKESSNQLITPPAKIRQFVQDVIDFSSQYGKENSSSYTVSNIRSRPNYFPKYGDFLESCVLRQYGKWWESESESSINIPISVAPLFISKDFIEVKFEQKLLIESVIIYETYHPGSIVAIYAFDYMLDKWQPIWSIFSEFTNFKQRKDALNRPMPPKSSCKFEPKLTYQNVFSDLLRIEFETASLEYYSEFDAIELVGLPYDSSRLSLIVENMKEIADLFDDPIKLSETNVQETNQNDDSIKELNKTNDSGTTTTTTSLNLINLPKEILVTIMSYLDLKTIFRLRSTCKTLYEICTFDFFFHIIDLQPYWYQVDDNFIQLLSMLTDNITMLNLSWTKLSQMEPLENLFSLSCKNHLTVLKLDCCNYLNGYLLKVISINCTELTHLSLRSCTHINSESDLTTNYGFNELKNLKKLIALDLYRTQCDQEALNEILFNCNHIKYLNLGSCIRIHDFDEICKSIANYCKQIKSLDLWRAYSLTPKGIYLLANNCQDLEELDIGWCRSINPIDCLQALIKNSKNLKKLFLTSIKITDRELELICRYSTKIVQLDILGSHSVSSHWTERILKTCKNLKLFDISFCNHIDMITHRDWTQIYTNVSIKKSFQSDI